MRKIFLARVSDTGEIVFENKQAVNEFLLKFRNKEIDVAIGRRMRRRSPPQNNYYWGVIIKMISDFTGHDEIETHEAMKMMFLQYEGEKGIRYCRSTSDLTTKEAEEYYDKIKHFAATQLELYIPDPNEVNIEEDCCQERRSFE